jgi:hypothetical protein
MGALQPLHLALSCPENRSRSGACRSHRRRRPVSSLHVSRGSSVRAEVSDFAHPLGSEGRATKGRRQGRRCGQDQRPVPDWPA